MKDKHTGKSRGFGYITMKDSLMVDTILRSQPIFIEGKLVECKIAIPKDHIQESLSANNIVIPVSNLNYSSVNESKFYFLN